jgi:threonine dehydrogenase-like Zn-dependent dehydrogenase
MATAALPTTMTAVRVHAPGDLRVDRVPVPRPGAGDVLVRVAFAGVCATDRKLAARGAPGGGVRTLGHEIVGAVVHSEHAALPPGTRVAVAPNVGEGSCPACLSGATNLCPDYRAFGIHLDGGMAEYLLVPRVAVEAGHLLRLPVGLADLDAALLEPLACCVEGLAATGLRAGESLLVVAAGVMGRLHVVAARALGAGTIVVVDRSRERLEHARALGADVAVDAGEEDLKAALEDANGGKVDVVLEMVGGRTTDASIAALAPFGRLVFFGMASRRPPSPVELGALMRRSRAVIGFWLMHCLADPARLLAAPMDELLAMTAAGDLRPVVGEVYALGDAAQAHRDLRERRTVGKLVLDPTR